LIYWLESDFQGFSDTQCLEYFDIVFHGKAMMVYRSDMHSFWHDNLDDPKVQQKLQRRVCRFLDLASDLEYADPRPLLFIRSLCGSIELGQTERLFELLKKNFERNGRKVYLLAILEDQPVSGPIFHSAYGGALLYWVQPLFKGPLTLDGDRPAPYEDAIAFAVKRVLRGLGLPEPGEGYPVVDRSEKLLDPSFDRGLQATEAGKWVGYLSLKGRTDKILFASFTGIDGYLGAVPLNPWPDEDERPAVCSTFCNMSSQMQEALGSLTLLSSCRDPPVIRKGSSSEVVV